MGPEEERARPDGSALNLEPAARRRRASRLTRPRRTVRPGRPAARRGVVAKRPQRGPVTRNATTRAMASCRSRSPGTPAGPPPPVGARRRRLSFVQLRVWVRPDVVFGLGVLFAALPDLMCSPSNNTAPRPAQGDAMTAAVLSSSTVGRFRRFDFFMTFCRARAASTSAAGKGVHRRALHLHLNESVCRRRRSPHLFATT